VNVHQKWHEVMKTIKGLSKDMTVNFQGKGGQVNYQAMSADKVLGIVRPVLLTQGLNLTPDKISYSMIGKFLFVQVTYRVTDIISGDSFTYDSLGSSIDTSDKGPGIAMTYAHKTGLLKSINIPCGADADDISSLEHAEKEAEIFTKCHTHHKAVSDNILEAFRLGGPTENLKNGVLMKAKEHFDNLVPSELAKLETLTALYRENIEMVLKVPETETFTHKSAISKCNLNLQNKDYDSLMAQNTNLKNI